MIILPDDIIINKILDTINYLFSINVKNKIDKKSVKYEISAKTKRLKYIYIDEELFATVRTNGNYALTIHGSQIILNHDKMKKNCVIINNDIREYIEKSGSVFAKHVLNVGKNIYPESEAIIIDEKQNLIAIGKSILSQEMMKKMNNGVAVKIRHRINK